jgi:predicted lipid-binding transport protein (Tim44 family)
MRRFLILLAALLPLTGALLISDADARLGGARSMGSRGTHSYFAPPSTRLSPNSTQPFQRSQAPSGNYGQSGYGAAGLGAGSMFGRHPFMTGMLGGLVGAGIGGLLFGGGFFHPGLGFGGMFGTLIQLLILFFVVRWLFRRFFSNRMAGGGMMGPRPAFNAGSAGPRPGAFAGIAGGMGDGGSSSAPLQLSNEDFRAFEQCFLYVQEAWDNQDLGAIGRAATPEMVGYFREQLNALQRQGLRNRISDIRIEGMELSEAWSESGMDYGTVAMRFSMLDVTVDGSGRIVDGSATTRSLATEVWTFLRARNSHWVLSGIQQTR